MIALANRRQRLRRAAFAPALTLAAIVAGLASCATPRIALTPRFPDGEIRHYRLIADARTDIDVPGAGAGDRTILRADVAIRIGREGGRPAATVTVTPVSFHRDGRSAEPPNAQSARVVFDAAGRVESIRSAEGEGAPFGGSADDLGTIFGSTIARGAVRIADRWADRIGAEPGAAGVRRSRVAALRWVGGHRCAIVESAVSQPAERARETGGATLQLIGTETALVETAFAFDRGFPARVETIARGTYQVVGAPQPGTVTIASTTTLALREDGARTTDSATATDSRRPARS